ncbi:MAG: hypothetical protein IJO13_00985 [Lachnospiraceae bacterium]|nr:hypothetical protein [Lachnospiraceae bacterium]
MEQQLLEPEGIIRSLRLAFENPINLTHSLQRIRGMLSQLPSEKLYIFHDHGYISFYEQTDFNRRYLRRDSDRLYLLARKRYLRELLHTLDALRKHGYDSPKWNDHFEKLARLIRDYAAGNLDVARIVLTAKQYAWFTGHYRQKPFPIDDDSDPLLIHPDIPVRSKSEQKIGNTLWDFGVPHHYEEQLRINVQRLVDELASDLTEAGQLNGNLFYLQHGSCYWNVPKNLQFINASGSIWHTYDYRTGCITIFPDFTIMLVDGSLLYWEHEGLFVKFSYRVNAMERIGVMRLTDSIGFEKLIETTERESNNKDVLERLIAERILPSLWF